MTVRARAVCGRLLNGQRLSRSSGVS